MIKEKITPQIKDRIRNALKKTIETGDEHAFIMCKDSKGNLYPRDICRGNECEVQMEPLTRCFPDIAQGNFHTHADTSFARESLGDIKNRIPREILVDIVKGIAKHEGIDVTTPSQGDLVNTLVNKCYDRSEGTVCVGSDSISDRIDCWTAKDNVTEDDCHRGTMLRVMGLVGAGPPRDWVKKLFDKEIIDI